MITRWSLTFTLVALVSFACRPSEVPAEPYSTTTAAPNAYSARDHVVQSMIDSPYAMTVTSIPPSELNGQQWQVNYNGPERYSISWTRSDQNAGDNCQDQIATNGEVEVCYPSVEPGGKTITSEAMWIDGVLYSRDCISGQACRRWDVLNGSPHHRPSTGIDVAPLPESPIEALESARDLKWVDGMELGDAGSKHLRGLYNPIEVLLSLEADLIAVPGPSSSGAECSAFIPPSVGSADRFECQGINYSDETQYYEVHPATIDVWLSPDEDRILRVTMTVPRTRILPLGFEEFPEVTLDYRYSDSETELIRPDLSETD